MNPFSPRTLFRQHLALAVGLFALNFGCSAPPASHFESTEQPSLQIKMPMLSTAPWQWLSISSDEYVNSVASVMGISADQLLPSDHPLTQRAQFWMDRIDSALRTNYPDAMKNVPSPNVIISKGLGNEFATAANVCFTMPIHYSPATTSGTPTTIDTLALAVPSGAGEMTVLEDLGSTSFPCVERHGDAAFLQAYVDFVNSQPGNCRVSVETDASGSRLEIGTGCSMFANNTLAPAPYEFSAKRLLVVSPGAMVNYINLSAESFTDYPSEVEMASVIAHELGHYYGAHSVASSDRFDFFYKETFDNPKGRRTPDAPIQDTGLQLLAALKAYPSWMRGGAAVPGAQLDRRLFAYFIAVGAKAQQMGLSVCNDFNTDFLQIPPSTLKSLLDPRLAISQNQVAVYLDVEAKYATCAHLIPVTAASSGTTISFSDAASLLHIAPPSAANQSGIANMQDMSVYASKTLASEDSVIQPLLAQAESLNLGRYDAEQEADELSVGFLALAGIDPKAGADMSLENWRSNPNAEGVASHCAELRASGWRDASGRPVIVPWGIGKLDPHPNECFRSFDKDREIVAQAYDHLSFNPPPQPAGQTWQQIQQLAKSLQ